ncbi:ABC transporter permease [Leifsonia sp. ALI-44-B]|jgi:peptide/nickel transport system permease protein|uniref:ABC transporter permease n=1 Tax=Leifsonia sp. ALI-44-B TaxID=1933776 RepID=UPI00097BC86E|nr:ABC transporter permease [Leifsonia sp. ALI-44-B]ONI63874.1 ABC transporter permease [Leifsonia sp. ALI-44-B]
MVLYLVRRVLAAIGILLLISLFTYVIFFVLSPDPAVQICGKTCTPERIDQIRENLGLNQPFWAQYWQFLQGLFVGRTYGEGASAISCAAPCLGYSFQTNESVLNMITSRLPVSATVAIGAAILWLLVGVSGGLLSAVKQGTWWDRGAMMVALAGISLPNYFVALILQYVLVVQLQILPFPTAVTFGDDPGLWFASYLMPWMVLALAYASMYARLVRANVIDTLGENFMRTARAKGLPTGLILRRHALRPSLTPVVTLFGMDFAGLLGGALITETVFGLNGVGKLAADSISKNDQPVILGVTLLAAAFVVVGNVVVDLAYTALDPRVRIKSR